ESETHLFRIAQEAFTNIARHSGASQVRVQLRADGSHVFLVIEDNGRGLSRDDQANSLTLGMTGMRARARQVGGVLETSKPAGGGLKIDVMIPKLVPQETHG
ncbi:MAG: hypothetical protein RL328_1596, partial [Acidobacteriota bacterium]